MIHVRSAPEGLLLAGAGALVLITAGCSNNVDLGAGLAPNPGPMVSLSSDIQPIFTRSCALIGCHGEFFSQNLDLREGAAWSSLVNVPSTETILLHRVEPGDSDMSYLVHKLEGTQLSVDGSGTQMPQPPLQPLPPAEIQLIRSWIDQGAENN